MPPVLLSNLLASNEAKLESHRMTLTESLINAALSAIGDSAISNGVPSKQELQSSSITNPLHWDAVASCHKSNNQSDESYDKQTLAIRTCIDSIDLYRYLDSQSSYTKNTGVRGSPGEGKTCCMMYCLLYLISKGIVVSTIALQCARSLHLGGVHIHQLFLVPTEDSIQLYRRDELAILRLFKNPTKLDFLCCLKILFVEKLAKWMIQC